MRFQGESGESVVDSEADVVEAVVVVVTAGAAVVLLSFGAANQFHFQNSSAVKGEGDDKATEVNVHEERNDEKRGTNGVAAAASCLALVAARRHVLPGQITLLLGRL